MTNSFEVVDSFQVDFAPVTITKWRSKRTGLQICYINQPSPIVNGYFAVATEIPNDSGSPHTLEHLVFMGSKKYPYKGLLDNLGNRYFSSTNAWTAVDQTVYTLTTAGWEGFKTLLPIYLDHLFFPTITDEACLTEVYHIDEHATEKGVVFSEMQGIETESWFISLLNMQRTLYGPSSGYSSETGGLLKELRHLSNDQIREFHKAMYRPDNVSIIVTGTIDEHELLTVMSDFDNQLVSLPATPNSRPFVDSTHDEPLSKTVVKKVEFPSQDESMGEVSISWIGPKFDDDVVNDAIDMIGAYFTDSPISLFNKHLVEVENPIATDIDYSTDDFYRTAINFCVGGVPTERIEEADDTIKQLIADQTVGDNFDLEYMKQIIAQQKSKLIFQTERSPSFFQNCAVSDFLYGDPQKKHLREWCLSLQNYDTLLSWTKEDWCKLIKSTLVDNHSASILGFPSAKLNSTIKKENKDRKKAIKEKYGEEGLAQLGKQLEAAQAKNDTPIPDSLITQFGSPDPSKIKFIETTSYRAGTNSYSFGYEDSDEFAQKLQKEPQLPLLFHFEHYESQFLTINLVLSSSNIDKRLLRYFSVIEEIFNMSIQLPDRYIPFEEVVSLVNNDLIETSFDNGFEYQFFELATVKVKFECQNYNKAIQWLIDVLKYSVIERNRIKVIVEKIINSLPDKKRSDELMMYSCSYRTLYTDRSIRKAQDSIYNEQFYEDLLEDINNDKFDHIQKDLEDFKAQLFTGDNFKVIISGDCKKLDTPVGSWAKFSEEFPQVNPPLALEQLPRSFQFKSDIGNQCSKSAYLVSMAAAESTQLISSTPIPTDYLDDDIYVIALAREYLTAVEGPFWRAVRGTGLAYGVSMTRDLETGYLTFNIYRGSDAQQAWLVSKQIVDDYSSGKLVFDEISIENSISALVNYLANNESNLVDAALIKISDNVFRRRGPNYKATLLEKLKKVDADQLVRIMNKYFKPLFEAEHSVLFSSVPPSKVDEFKKFLELQGYSVTIETIDGAGDETDSEEDFESGSEEETDSESESSDEDSGSR